MKIETADNLFPELFKDVQMAAIFPDGKTFADATALIEVAEINKKYESEKAYDDFQLRDFVLRYFDIPSSASDFESNKERSVEEHIESLWAILSREGETENTNRDSRISIPYPYVVPGGRFNEMYYWDSYFTMLGLAESGRMELVRSMVENFAWMIDNIGHIPNGNRSYFLSRSQPPFFSSMVELLAETDGKEIYKTYLPQLLKEHEFWMNGLSTINKLESVKRVVILEDGTVVNRYWDASNKPRQEMYKDDVELAESSNRFEEELYRNIRAACESGWDFSSRWFSANDLDSINTNLIIPVDLNALLYHLEKTIAKGLEVSKQSAKMLLWNNKAMARAGAIRSKFWNKEKNFFTDLDAVTGESNGIMTAAGMFPLYFKIANEQQAKNAVDVLEEHFVQAGGVVTTIVESGQQWDWPNGWAPLQWIAIEGLRNYGYHDLATRISQSWIDLNSRVYKQTGKLLEKYNVVDMSLEAGGGEYPVQDGFGWTNGVLLSLIKRNQSNSK